MRKKFLMLSALASLCLSISACDEETVGEIFDGMACNPAEAACDGDKANTCVDGIYKVLDCSTSGQVCVMGDNGPACQAKPADENPSDENSGNDNPNDGNSGTDNSCDDGTVGCTGNVAWVCINGTKSENDCQDKVCDNGQCKEKCTSQCSTDNKKVICDEQGKEISSEPCGANEICEMNGDTPTCVVDNTPVPTGGGIGEPCTCVGDNCNNVITAAEIKAMLPSDMIPAEALVFLDLFFREGDDTTGPNFFAGDSIKGCENVVVPEGMTLGCVRDSEVKFTTGLSSIAGIIGDPTMESLEIPATLKQAMALLNEHILKPGLKFEAGKGYCTVGAMSVTGEMEGMDMNAFFGKLNAGDYASAKAATCPAGSVMLDYGMENQISGGYVMCSKSCTTNEDCRVDDGYTCESVPSALPGTDQTLEDMPTVKVCIDKDNITMLESMLEAFTPLMEDAAADAES